MKFYDIIIVGAGPAGSALAVQLAAAGYTVALLEQASFPRDKVCGDLVSARGLAWLQDLGCLDQVTATGQVPIREARVFLNGHFFSSGRMPPVPGLPPHGHAIPRRVLDEIIFRRAQQVGADTVEHCRVTGFETDRRGVRVAAAVAGKPTSFSGRMIVGADGARSVIAKCAGLEMRDPRYVFPAVRAYCEGLPLDHAVLCFEEEFFPGYGWVFPVADGGVNIGVGMVQETLLRNRLVLKDFYRRLEHFVQRLGAEHGTRVRIQKSAGWVIKAYGASRRTHFERGLLIGEAGCFVDPLTGEGIPLALGTARMARDAIVNAFSRGDFGITSLADYERAWRVAYEADLRVSDLVVSASRNRGLLGLWTTMLKLMAMTAEKDEPYALALGGIMAGLVPAREGLSAEIIRKSLLHGPAFWMQLLGIRPGRRLEDLAIRGVQFAGWQAGVLRGMADDPAWFGAWALELLGKEFRLAAALRPQITAGRVPAASPRLGISKGAAVAGEKLRSAPTGGRKALVIGATGHIGNAVVRELLARGWEVTAASRRSEPPANLAGLPVAFLRGDCDDTDFFESSLAGQDLVVDAAAPYPIHWILNRRGGQLLDRVARRTQGLVDAARHHGAALAYVGSFASAQREGDRFARLQSGVLRGLHPYFAVKQGIEQQLLAAMENGLQAVIVNPTVCIGPWDLKPREHCLIPQLLCGEVPGLVRHPVNVIDVRDVALAVAAAAEAKRYGEVVPLSGHNVSSDSLVRRICEMGGGVRPPRYRVPTAAALVGTLVTEAALSLANRPSPSPALATMLVAECPRTSPSPAQCALGVWPRPLSLSLSDAIAWYRQLAYC